MGPGVPGERYVLRDRRPYGDACPRPRYFSSLRLHATVAVRRIEKSIKCARRSLRLTHVTHGRSRTLTVTTDTRHTEGSRVRRLAELANCGHVSAHQHHSRGLVSRERVSESTLNPTRPSRDGFAITPADSDTRHRWRREFHAHPSDARAPAPVGPSTAASLGHLWTALVGSSTCCSIHATTARRWSAASQRSSAVVPTAGLRHAPASSTAAESPEASADERRLQRKQEQEREQEREQQEEQQQQQQQQQQHHHHHHPPHARGCRRGYRQPGARSKSARGPSPHPATSPFRSAFGAVWPPA